MVSMYNIVATITMTEMGYGCELIINWARTEAEFQPRGAPSAHRSVAFVCPQGNRPKHMRGAR
jgi:hypothetical protein